MGVIESREDGKGVAYSAVHPDYRLNGPNAVHIVMPDRPNDFHDYFNARNTRSRFGGMGWFRGIFARRADFGRYMAELFQGHQAVNGMVPTSFISCPRYVTGYWARLLNNYLG